MSWVTITNGVIKTKVPKQAFEDLYQKNGFSVVEDIPTHIKPKEENAMLEGEQNDKPRASTRARNESKSANKLPVVTKQRN